MIDHVTIRVSDFAASKVFYSTVLAPLGYELAWEDAEKRLAEWGDFSIAEDGKPLTEYLHVAFAAPDNATVDEFHRVARSRLPRQRRPGRAPLPPGNLRP